MPREAHRGTERCYPEARGAGQEEYSTLDHLCLHPSAIPPLNSALPTASPCPHFNSPSRGREQPKMMAKWAGEKSAHSLTACTSARTIALQELRRWAVQQSTLPFPSLQTTRELVACSSVCTRMLPLTIAFCHGQRRHSIPTDYSTHMAPPQAWPTTKRTMSPCTSQRSKRRRQRRRSPRSLKDLTRTRPISLTWGLRSRDRATEVLATGCLQPASAKAAAVADLTWAFTMHVRLIRCSVQRQQ